MADERNVRPDERDEDAKAGVDVAATLKDGLFAVRDVHLAARKHSSARARLRSMREAVEVDGQTLARREEVEASYEDIVAEQTKTVEEASEELEGQQATIERLEKQADELEERLAKLKEDHEQELRPYKRIAETARGRSEDANRGVSEAKRAVRTAVIWLKLNQISRPRKSTCQMQNLIVILRTEC